MEILLGLTAAIFWGIGDFLGRYATQRIGTYTTIFFFPFIGFFGLGAYLLVTGQLQYLLSNTSWQPWMWALLVALLNVASTFALYRSFEIGTLTLVSPIASSYAAITIVLALFNGETLTMLRGSALWIVLFGLILAATPFANLAQTAHTKTSRLPRWQKSSLRGMAWALVAAFGYGTTFWLLAFHVTAQLGGVVPVWLMRATTPCVLGLCMPVFRQPLKLPRNVTWLFIAGVGVFDTLAYLAYTFGLVQRQVSVLTMLSSLYSVVTVLLALVFLREKLQRSQWLGIGIIFVGIALINA